MSHDPRGPNERTAELSRYGLAPQYAPAGHTFGTVVFFAMALVVAQQYGIVAAVPHRAGLGCVRRGDIFLCVAAVLVHGDDSRPGDATRSGHDAVAATDLRLSGDGLAEFRAAL